MKKISQDLLMALYSSSPEDLIKAKFPLEVVQELDTHTTADQKTLMHLCKGLVKCEVRDGEASFTIDFECLKDNFELLRSKNAEQDLADEFLEKGASNEAMWSLFEMTRNTTVLRRKMLKTQKMGTGGGPLSEDFCSEIAYFITKKNLSELDDKNLLLALHDETGEPISKLWIALRKIKSSTKADRTYNNYTVDAAVN